MIDKTKRKQLGDSIRRNRQKQRYSQQTLAAMIGTSKSHIWRIENGRVSVGIDEIVAISKALDVAVRSLIDF